MPLRKHEMVYVFYEKLPFYDLSSHKHKFLKEDKQVIKQESKEESKEGLAYKPSFCQKDNADNQYRKLGRKGGESAYEPPLPTSILEIASQRSKHSTQKPVELMKWVLKYYSKENDIILDNCMGSGSTGVACKEMNRRFIGIEMDKDIFKVAEERLS
jgi:site-specific DNA-methyltransferase (adenine-specific)